MLFWTDNREFVTLKFVPRNCEPALTGSSSWLHSEACNALGASDGVIHSNVSLQVSACERLLTTNNRGFAAQQFVPRNCQFALIGSRSGVHSEACNASGASDDVNHKNISLQVVSLDLQKFICTQCRNLLGNKTDCCLRRRNAQHTMITRSALRCTSVICPHQLFRCFIHLTILWIDRSRVNHSVTCRSLYNKSSFRFTCNITNDNWTKFTLLTFAAMWKTISRKRPLPNLTDCSLQNRDHVE